MSDEKDKLDPALRPKRKGPLSPEEQMEIMHAVMRKNRDVLAALATNGQKPPTTH